MNGSWKLGVGGWRSGTENQSLKCQRPVHVQGSWPCIVGIAWCRRGIGGHRGLRGKLRLQAATGALQNILEESAVSSKAAGTGARRPWNRPGQLTMGLEKGGKGTGSDQFVFCS